MMMMMHPQRCSRQSANYENLACQPGQ